jgi:hypothetical protein
MSSNPFEQLICPTRKRLPKSGSTTVVLGGKRITDVRQIDPDERAVYEELVKRAAQAARYQRQRANPERMAKRAQWQEANRDKVRAYKQQWNAEHQDQVRQSKREHAARAYQADPEKKRASAKAYYQRNREAILAKNAEQREARRQAKAALDNK